MHFIVKFNVDKLSVIIASVVAPVFHHLILERVDPIRKGTKKKISVSIFLILRIS